jgi:hypothetical protein
VHTLCALSAGACHIAMYIDLPLDTQERSSLGGEDTAQDTGLVLLVELWRSDLLTSVVELDSEGNVMNTADQEAMAELYPPGGWWAVHDGVHPQLQPAHWPEPKVHHASTFHVHRLQGCCWVSART